MSHSAAPRVEQRVLEEIVNRLVTALSPLAIYLFGSQLYGSPGRDSDIDVFIVVPDGSPNGVEMARRGYACLHGLGLPVELHISSRSRFERFSEVIGSLQHEIHRKGKLIYAAEA